MGSWRDLMSDWIAAVPVVGSLVSQPDFGVKPI
jgi:hypothetical protein